MGPERSVLLIHSYLKDRRGKDRPDRLTRACLVAASELKRRGEIDKVVITVTERLARPMVRELNQIGHFEVEDVVVYPQTATTDDEVKTFKDLALKNEWGNLKTLGIKAHIPRIENSISRHFGENQKVPVLSAENVLSQNPRYSQVLSEMKSWPETTSLENQEEAFAKVSSKTPAGKFIVEIVPNFFPARLKIALQYLLLRFLEK